MRGRLGGATAAQFYGAQRSIVKSLTKLSEAVMAVIGVVLERSPKTDARGSAVPFAFELASYLAHCVKEGGLLSLIDKYERTPFEDFYDLLSGEIAALIADDLAWSSGEDDSDDPGDDAAGGASAPPCGCPSGSVEDDDYDDETGERTGYWKAAYAASGFMPARVACCTKGCAMRGVD